MLGYIARVSLSLPRSSSSSSSSSDDDESRFSPVRGLLDRFDSVGEGRGDKGDRPGECPAVVKLDKQGESLDDVKGINGSRESCFVSSRGDGRLNVSSGDDDEDEEELEREGGRSVIVEPVSSRCNCKDCRDASYEEDEVRTEVDESPNKEDTSIPEEEWVIEAGNCPAGSTSVERERLEMVVEELVESKSECARVYLSVLISSAKGLRNETRLEAGNSGRFAEHDILRESMRGIGLLDNIETK